LRLALLIASLLPLVAAAECVTRSGPTTAALVELYTSEGCSSCPPADRWLSQLKTAAARGSVVPLAFHVTYWDYIGWRDAYADERHAARQRARARASGARYVYTPQVVLGGRDFRGWSGGRSAAQALEAINRLPARADIEIRLQPIAAGKLVVEATATAAPGVRTRDLALVIAATQDGLSSRVTAGENRGEKLRHDFVVREFAEARPFASQRAVASVTFSARGGWKPEAMALAAFVQDLETGEVLQALSAPLGRCQAA
jgi:hypothetical protein